MLKRGVSPGFSLTECLLAAVLGAGVLLAMMTLYLRSQIVFDVYRQKMYLYQDIYYAMHLLETNLRQAGFGHLTSASVVLSTDFIEPDGMPAQSLRGCDGGFVQPFGKEKNFSCKSSSVGSSGFEVRYRVDDHFNADTGAGADCNGAQVKMSRVPYAHPAYDLQPFVRIARNIFFVATHPVLPGNFLYCHGNGGEYAQPILSNVVDMQLRYGVHSAEELAPFQFLTAAEVTALSEDQIKNWQHVVSARLCLQIHSDAKIGISSQRYTDCFGTERIAVDRKLHAVITRTIQLIYVIIWH